jgi:hypothetical protein
MDQIFYPSRKSLASLFCLSMLTLLKHAYSTRLKSSKHAKMSAKQKRGYSPNLFYAQLTIIFNPEMFLLQKANLSRYDLAPAKTKSLR